MHCGNGSVKLGQCPLGMSPYMRGGNKLPQVFLLTKFRSFSSFLCLIVDIVNDFCSMKNLSKKRIN